MENFFWVFRPYSKPAPPLPPKTEIFYFMMPLCFGWPETSTKLGPRCLSLFVRFLYSDFQIATLLCKPKHLAIFFNIEISFWFFFLIYGFASLTNPQGGTGTPYANRIIGGHRGSSYLNRFAGRFTYSLYLKPLLAASTPFSHLFEICQDQLKICQDLFEICQNQFNFCRKLFKII